MDMIRWGILGTARIVNRMANAIQLSDKGDLIAIGSRSKNKVEEFVLKFNILEKYNSYQELLESTSIDAVYIPLPNHLHKKWTIEAARNKKHVLCEKPFALTPIEVKEMFAEAKKSSIVLMEGFMYRFNPVVDKIKEILSQNTLGKIKYVNFCFSHNIANYLGGEDNYRYYKDQGGGSLLDLGVYGINFFNFLFEYDSVEVLNSLSFQKSKEHSDSTYFATLRYNYQTICQITCSFEFFGNYLIISGTNGSIEVNHLTSDGRKTIFVKNDRNQVTSEIFIPEYDHFKAQIDHFNECIIANKKVLVSQEDTFATISIVDQLREKEEKILLN